MAVLIFSPHKNTNDLINCISEVSIWGLMALIFSSIALMGHLAGEFDLKGFKATKIEKPLIFYSALFSYIVLSIVFFVGFIKHLLDLLDMLYP